MTCENVEADIREDIVDSVTPDVDFFLRSANGLDSSVYSQRCLVMEKELSAREDIECRVFFDDEGVEDDVRLVVGESHIVFDPEAGESCDVLPPGEDRYGLGVAVCQEQQFFLNEVRF